MYINRLGEIELRYGDILTTDRFANRPEQTTTGPAGAAFLARGSSACPPPCAALLLGNVAVTSR